jgi:hypothetical protein
MANKLHLQANVGINAIPYALCSVRSIGHGKVRRNSRTTYADIPQANIVSFEKFKTIDASDRCAHCCAAGLLVRNRQRKAKGLDPVKSLFEC